MAYNADRFTNVQVHDSAIIDKGAEIGANATVVCGTTIGRYAFIGAGAVVTRDVPDYALIVGVPGRQVGWMSEFGEQLALQLDGDGEVTCAHTGARYVLSAGKLSRT